MERTVTIREAGNLLNDGRFRIRFGKRELEFTDEAAARRYNPPLFENGQISEDALVMLEMQKHWSVDSKPTRIADKTLTLDVTKLGTASVPVKEVARG